jgi:hypothetical protein
VNNAAGTAVRGPTMPRTVEKVMHSTTRRWGFRGFLAVLAVAVASIASPAALGGGVAAADDTPPVLAKMAGSYKYSNTRDHGVAIVEKATEEALADLNMVMRLLIKKALSSSFAEAVLIETPPGKIGMKVGDLDKTVQGVGKTETVKTSDGKREAKLTYDFDGSRIKATLAAEEMTVVSYFTLAGDGKTLARDVTVTGKRISKPIKYRLVYTRK